MSHKNRKYTDEQLLDAIREEAQTLGHTPIHDQWTKANPHRSTIIKRFGSWNQAMTKAGLEPNLSGKDKKNPRRELIKRALLGKEYLSPEETNATN